MCRSCPGFSSQAQANKTRGKKEEHTLCSLQTQAGSGEHCYLPFAYLADLLYAQCVRKGAGPCLACQKKKCVCSLDPVDYDLTVSLCVPGVREETDIPPLQGRYICLCRRCIAYLCSCTKLLEYVGVCTCGRWHQPLLVCSEPSCNFTCDCTWMCPCGRTIRIVPNSEKICIL